MNNEESSNQMSRKLNEIKNSLRFQIQDAISTSFPAERCWKGAGAHLKLKNLKLEDTAGADKSTSQEDTKNKQPSSILKNPKN